MRKLLPVLLIAALAAVLWFLLSGDPPARPDDPKASGPSAAQQVDPGALPAGAGAPPATPGLGRSEVTEQGSQAAELAAGPAGEIRGQVLDPQGEPLAGASVLLLRRGEGSAFMLGQDHSAVVDAKLSTDREGWYRVKGLASGTAWNVWAWHEDFAFAEGVSVEGLAGAEQELPPIRMIEGFVVEVRLVDVQGAPVADAEVVLSLDGLPEPADDRPDPLGRRFTTVSESDGFAGFENVGPGSWVLHARKAGLGDGWMRPVVILPGREPPELKLVLGPEFPVRGLAVSTAGGPVAGALAVLDTDPPGAGPRFEAETDAEGRFRLDGVPEGHFLLTVSRRGFFASRPESLDEASGRDLRVELQPIGALRGRLLGADGRAAREGRIELWQTIRGQPPYLPTDTVITVDDPEGRFTMDFEGGGSFVLLAHAAGAAPAWSEPLQTRTDPIDLGEWRLNAGATLRGRLTVGADAAPLGGALIRLRTRAWSEEAELNPFMSFGGAASEVPPVHARSDAQGGFAFPHLPPGAYALSVEHPDAVTHSFPISCRDGEEQDLGALQLEAASTLVAVATFADGRPIAGGMLMVSQDENSLLQRNRMLDASGRARMPGLRSGDYWVTVSEGGGLFGRTSTPQRVWLEVGETKEVALQLDAR